MLQSDLHKCTSQSDVGTVVRNVLIGIDGYLFLHQGNQRQFDFLSGVTEPSRQSVQNFARNLSQRRIFCDRYDAKYIHVLFPSKPVVKRRFIPDPYNENIESLYLRYYQNEMNQSTLGSFIYPLKTLLEHEDRFSTYKKLDTHMTHLGCNFVTQLVLAKLGLQYNWSDFFLSREVAMGGDLANILADDRTNQEIGLIQRGKRPTVFDNRSSLPGNTNNAVVQYAPQAATNKRLLIFGDSFILTCLQFFGVVFRDILYVRSSSLQRELAVMFKPDVIITSEAERYLSNVGTDQRPSSHLLDLYGMADYSPDPEFREALAAQLSARYHPRRYEEWASRVAG